VLVTDRRPEDRGDVRGGRFVSGLIGEQFALPTSSSRCGRRDIAVRTSCRSPSRQPIR